MPYLIDGHNLIPKLPGLSLHSLDDEVQLIQRLQEFCRRTGKSVEVYFDNAPLDQARTQRFGSVKAHFIRTGYTADEAIIARLRTLGRAARNWYVVSSDRQIIAAAKATHAQIISAERFTQLIIEDQPDGGVSPEVDADLSLGPDEINVWLDLFNQDDDLSG